MELRVISDVHVEYYDDSKILIDRLNKYFPTVNSEKEILIIAGDIGMATDGNRINSKYLEILKYFRSRWKYIILVPGNHEWYGSTIPMSEVNDILSHECEKLGIE